MNPAITVYMPTHNRADLVKLSVDSVLKQSFKDFELIVVNDGSKDHTKQVLDEISRKDTRVKVIHKATAEGACAARNTAIAAARGRFITGLDDDDTMTSDALQVYVDSWSDEYRFLCADFVEPRRLAPSRKVRIFDKKDLLRTNVVGNQVFTLTEYLQKTGFDESLKSWQDYDAWLELISDGMALKLPNQIYLIAQDLGRSRITNSSNSKKGALQFLSKHGWEMEASLVPFWLVSDLLNRNQTLPVWLQISAFLVGDGKRIIQYWIRKNLLLQKLKSLILVFR